MAMLIKQHLVTHWRSWDDRDAAGTAEPRLKANAVVMTLSWTRLLGASVSGENLWPKRNSVNFPVWS